MLLDHGASVDATKYVSQPTCLAALLPAVHGAAGPRLQRLGRRRASCPAGWLARTLWSGMPRADERWRAHGRGCVFPQKGNTVMIFASSRCNVDIVRMLLDRGASVDATGDVSQPACHAEVLRCLHAESSSRRRRIECGRARLPAGWLDRRGVIRCAEGRHAVMYACEVTARHRSLARLRCKARQNTATRTSCGCCSTEAPT